MFARIGNGVFHYKQSFINTHNKNSSVFQQMEEFFIAYTQSIPKKCPVKVFHRALKHFLLFSYRNFLPDIRQSV